MTDRGSKHGASGQPRKREEQHAAGRTERESGAAPETRPGTEGRSQDRSGPRGSDIDRMALESPKSDWVSSTDPAAGDPITPEERNAQDLLGHESVRDAALEGPGGLDDNPDDERRSAYERRPVQPDAHEQPPTIDEVENREERR